MPFLKLLSQLYRGARDGPSPSLPIHPQLQNNYKSMMISNQKNIYKKPGRQGGWWGGGSMTLRLLITSSLLK